MCLAVPGKIIEVREAEGAPGEIATVDFHGTTAEVSLAMAPEAVLGSWVLVHAGFAITLLDEEQARETWGYLEEFGMGEMPPELKAK